MFKKSMLWLFLYAGSMAAFSPLSSYAAETIEPEPEWSQECVPDSGYTSSDYTSKDVSGQSRTNAKTNVRVPNKMLEYKGEDYRSCFRHFSPTITQANHENATSVTYTVDYKSNGYATHSLNVTVSSYPVWSGVCSPASGYTADDYKNRSVREETKPTYPEKMIEKGTRYFPHPSGIEQSVSIQRDCVRQETVVNGSLPDSSTITHTVSYKSAGTAQHSFVITSYFASSSSLTVPKTHRETEKWNPSCEISYPDGHTEYCMDTSKSKFYEKGRLVETIKDSTEKWNVCYKYVDPYRTTHVEKEVCTDRYKLKSVAIDEDAKPDDSYVGYKHPWKCEAIFYGETKESSLDISNWKSLDGYKYQSDKKEAYSDTWSSSPKNYIGKTWWEKGYTDPRNELASNRHWSEDPRIDLTKYGTNDNNRVHNSFHRGKDANVFYAIDPSINNETYTITCSFQMDWYYAPTYVNGTSAVTTYLRTDTSTTQVHGIKKLSMVVNGCFYKEDSYALTDCYWEKDDLLPPWTSKTFWKGNWYNFLVYAVYDDDTGGNEEPERLMSTAPEAFWDHSVWYKYPASFGGATLPKYQRFSSSMNHWWDHLFTRSGADFRIPQTGDQEVTFKFFDNVSAEDGGSGFSQAGKTYVKVPFTAREIINVEIRNSGDSEPKKEFNIPMGEHCYESIIVMDNGDRKKWTYDAAGNQKLLWFKAEGDLISQTSGCYTFTTRAGPGAYEEATIAVAWADYDEWMLNKNNGHSFVTEPTPHPTPKRPMTRHGNLIPEAPDARYFSRFDRTFDYIYTSMQVRLFSDCSNVTHLVFACPPPSSGPEAWRYQRPDMTSPGGNSSMTNITNYLPPQTEYGAAWTDDNNPYSWYENFQVTGISNGRGVD